METQTNDPVAHLLRMHAADEIRSYSGNLAAVTWAVDNSWIPSDDDPGVPGLVESLQRFLSESGNPEDDSFLLRYGLTAPGRQRGIVPPMMVLEENRGGFSERRQREAEGQIRRVREALTIGRFFFSRLDGDTRQAILDLADLCNRFPRANDEELLLQFRQLSDAQAERLATEAMRCVAAEDKSLVDIGILILQRVACFRDDGLSDASCNTLIAKSVFWPSSLYREANESVASRLVKLIEQGPNQSTLNHLLLALAWTRSKAALGAFRSWSQRPPRWAQSLHLPPEEYLPSAGWCLDEQGNCRDLVSLGCHRLVGPTGSATANVTCRTTLNDNCPSCGGPQGLLFDFADTIEDYFKDALAGAPRQVLCCLHCCCYETVFTRYSRNSTAEWLSPLEPSEFTYEHEECPERCYRILETSTIPSFAHAEPYNVSDASTLGGIPTWLQDAEFPRCIECGQFMAFLAQHDNGPLSEEGVYYAFFCAKCRISAVTYQQT